MITNEFLSKLVDTRTDPSGILRLFREAGFSFEALKSPVDSSVPYSRTVLHAGDDCEIMLAHWTPGVSCAPHDHGKAEGWVFYLRGDFQELSYAWDQFDLRTVKKVMHQQGSHIDVSDDTIHSCKAMNGGLSLHVYFPRIENMRVHDLENRRTLVVADHCGAWIPKDFDDIKEEISWPRPLVAAL